jgi:hypothetical protein
MEYQEMNRQQRAAYLLEKGVIAELAIDAKTMTPAYIAVVPCVGSLPCGCHDDEQGAITAGTNWLRAIVSIPQGEK